jgi:hypothetical protein
MPSGYDDEPNESGLNPTWPDDGLARGGYPLHWRHDVGLVCVRQPISPFTNQTVLGSGLSLHDNAPTATN